MFSKVVKKISTAVFTLIDHFQNSPKVNNLFGLHLRVNLLPRTLKIAQSGHTASKLLSTQLIALTKQLTRDGNCYQWCML